MEEWPRKGKVDARRSGSDIVLVMRVRTGEDHSQGSGDGKEA